MSRALIAALVVCAVGLAGCSDDGSDAGPRTPTPTVTTPITTSTSPAAPSPSDPSTSPGVEPATGDLLELDGMSLRVPEGWDVVDRTDTGFTASRRVNVVHDTLDVRIQDNLGISEPLASTIEMRNDLQVFYERDPQVEQPVVIDGLKMFHLSGQVSDNFWAEAYGSDLGDHTIDVSFLFGPKTSPAERREAVDSVLATVEIG